MTKFRTYRFLFLCRSWWVRVRHRWRSALSNAVHRRLSLLFLLFCILFFALSTHSSMYCTRLLLTLTAVPFAQIYVSTSGGLSAHPTMRFPSILIWNKTLMLLRTWLFTERGFGRSCVAYSFSFCLFCFINTPNTTGLEGPTTRSGIITIIQIRSRTMRSIVLKDSDTQWLRRLSSEAPSNGEEGYRSTEPYSFELQQAMKSKWQRDNFAWIFLCSRPEVFIFLYCLHVS